MTSTAFIELTKDHKIVPVFYHSSADVTIKTMQAAYDGGVRIFEFVNRGENALKNFKEAVTHFQKYNDFILGIGTIYDSSTAHKFLESGAQFIVSPGLVPELATYCLNNNVAYIPGVATITEATTAMHLGSQMIKLFPANVIGCAFAKAVKSVLPQLNIMPTGGIRPNQEDLYKWFESGVNCVGMGSQLFDKEKIRKQDFASLSSDIKQAVILVSKF